MAKIMFVFQRRRDQTREQCLQFWSGATHIAIVRKLPELTKWVQSHVISAPEEAACDGLENCGLRVTRRLDDGRTANLESSKSMRRLPWLKDNAGKRYFSRPSFEVPISYLIPV